jgi:hypothetical protein
MHPTKIVEKCLGTHPAKLSIGDVQHMVFLATDQGPFGMGPETQLLRREDRVVGRVVKAKPRLQLLNELVREKKVSPRRGYSLKELVEIATANNIAVENEQDKVEPGWVGKPKGIFQVLHERGWIDLNMPRSMYTLTGKRAWKDSNGNMPDEYLQYCLCHVINECADFKNEVTAMQELAKEMSDDTTSFEVLYTPKYHCEIAGEGIEYSWGLSKKEYQSLHWNKKKGLTTFGQV